jgi:transcriptional regulator with XRE-family HTH domain
VTADQVVAWNLAWYRRAAGMTQRELEEELGWKPGRASEAERSWDSGRTREFNAQLLADLATILGIPVAGLFNPDVRAELAGRLLARAEQLREAAADFAQVAAAVAPPAGEEDGR